MTSKEKRQFTKILKRIDWIVEHGTDEQRATLDKLMSTLKRLKDAKQSGAKVTIKDAGSDMWLVIHGGKRTSREQLEKRMDELARKYAETYDPEIKAEIEKLSFRLVAQKRSS